MKKNTKKQKFNISTTWLVVATVVVLLAVAIWTNKTVEFKTINTNDLTALYKAEKQSIVYIGRPDCSYCEKYEPTLKSVAAEYNLEINYYNLNSVASQEEYNTFTKIDPYFGEGTWGTPLVVIVGNSKLETEKINGQVSQEETVNYFKKIGFIK